MTLYNYLIEVKKLPEIEASMIRTAYIFRCKLTEEQKELIKDWEKGKKQYEF